MVEWGIVSIVILAILWVFGRQVQVVQGQGEKVMVWSMLTQFRAALMIDQLAHQIRPADGKPAQTNPFPLLQLVPPSFVGELAAQHANSASPGSWMFDTACGCVGYRLLYPQWLEPAQAADTIWFRIVVTTDEVRLVSDANYLWFGQALP